jgi:hypothetical protein
MGSQVPLVWASPNMKAKSQLLSFKKPLKYDYLSLKLDLDYFMQLVLKVGSNFLLDPTPNESPEPHLQKVLP